MTSHPAPTSTEALFASLGIQEVEANVCDDTPQHRRLLSKAGVVYRMVPPPSGTTAPTGLLEIDIAPDAKDRANASSFERNQNILTNPKDPWSDYIPLNECPLDFWETAPHFLLRALRTYEEAVEQGLPIEKRPILPERCRRRRGDGTRCWNWSWAMNPHAPFQCRTHGPYLAWNRTEEIQRLQESAKLRLAQLTDDAVDVMDFLMQESKVDQVRLRAATELLDRAGLKPGQELTISGNLQHEHTIDPAQAVRERLQALADRIQPAGELENADADADVIDGEVIEDEQQPVRRG